MRMRTWLLASLMTTGCAYGVAETTGPLECEMSSRAADYVYEDERLGVDDNIHDLAAASDGTLYFVTGFDADLPVPVGDTLYFRCSGSRLCSSDLSGTIVSTVAGELVTDLHGPLLADDRAVYGLEGRSIVRVPFDGGTPTTLVANAWVQDLDVTPWGAVADGYVYFVDGATHTLSRVSVAGGEQQTIVHTPLTSLSGIAVRGNSVVYNADAVYQLTLGTAHPTAIPFVSGGAELRGSPVLVDPSGAIYMTTMDGILRIDASFSSCSGIADEWIDAGPSSQVAVGRDGVYYTSVDRTAISYMVP